MNVADLFKHPPPDWTEPDNERRRAAVAWAEPLGDDIERALATCPPGVMLMILADTALYSGDFGLFRENVHAAMGVVTEEARARIRRAFQTITEPHPRLPAVKATMANFLRLGGEPRRVGSFAFPRGGSKLN